MLHSGQRIHGNHFLNWWKLLLITKAKSINSASGKMTSIGTIINEMIIPHSKGNIGLNPEFVVLEVADIKGFFLGTDYQRMYGIDIYNGKNRHIAIGRKEEQNFFLIYTICQPVTQNQSTSMTAKIP
ncbi:hypothetical protein O181_008485 [Austropuccinia psidii MF-1]|uniref:Homing endonuclease LAGLIDADG domain-containing protein n=1 Tax=Austropuccinia psidii MF-1 TaxID=1389203 RepID=A0A9Q3BPF7_9BASI|nr:hypothetical protein [Austropuccinia psidii MF-1]